MMKIDDSHVVLDLKSMSLKCRHCGAAKSMELPIEVGELVKLGDAFQALHLVCAKP